MRTTSTARKATLLLFSVAVLLADGVGRTVRGQSALDGFDPNANGIVQIVVVQPDGKILIGGDFTTLAPNGGASFTRNYIARLNPDGTVDTAFDPNASASVYSIAVQADGKILAGGAFTTIGGQTRNNIARLDPATGLADSFNPNANGAVAKIVVQADGKILVGGAFSGANSIGGETRNGIARLDPITGLADSFDPNANHVVLSITVQADGKILAGGLFSGANSIGGQARNFIARLDATTGAADPLFDPNASGFYVQSIAVQADGKILAGGSFTTIGGQTRNNIARLGAATGSADSFDPNADAAVISIVVQADGKILAGGNFHIVGGQTRNRIARLDPITGLADSFDPNATVFLGVYTMAVQADGKILAGGSFTSLSPNGGAAVPRNNIARLETDGRLDYTLNPSVIGGKFVRVAATAVQPDGKILIGGDFFSVSGVERNNIARLNPDGSLDTFNPNANGPVESITVQADGKILVGGRFIGPNSIGGQMRFNIARLDPTTGLADSWDPRAGAVVYAIAVQADGKILAGGFFGFIGGQLRNRIARLDPITGLADSFDPNANDTVYSIAVQADGKILAGGDFTTVGGQPRNHIARLNTDGALDTAFNPNANDDVRSIVVQSDGKILAGGNFRLVGGQQRNYIARLNTDGALDIAFNPDANDGVRSIAVQADGKILAGGAFVNIGGQLRRRIARLDPTTGLADSFDPNVNPFFVYSIALQADGKILAGGVFESIGGQERNNFARLNNDTIALQNLAATQTSVTWTLGGSGPQFARVTFEESTDSVNYNFLGHGTAAGSNWTLTGLNLPIGQNLYIRARGHHGTGQSESIQESVRNAFIVAPVPSTLGNISTRLRVETGDNILIGGFIITGTQPKKVIVRAIGPSLSPFFSGALADPILEIRDSSGGLIASNDNWRSDHEAEIIATGIPPTNDLESAIVVTLPPNNTAYTAIVRGVNNGTGIGVIEAYDLDQTVDSKLANISTRGFVQTGDNVLIGGLIVLGQNSLRVIVRAIGPSLPLPGALADPTLSLHDNNGTPIVSNDNWRTGGQEAEIIATGIPPTNDFESAIVRDLAPGAYTAIVRGVNNTTGIAVVEAYGLN